MKSHIFFLLRIIVPVIVLTITSVGAERNACCENNSPIVGRKCENGGKNWASFCPNGGYVLNRAAFNLSTNDSITITLSGRVQTQEKYCLNPLKTNDTLTDIAIICFPIQPKDAAVQSSNSNHFILYVLSIISLVSLLLTLLVYLLLPKLRDLQGKCLMITVFNLFMGFLTLTFLHREGHYYHYGTCLLLASSTYFWFLSTFIWMNIVSFNIWKSTVFPNLLSNKKHLFLIYNIYGWGVSILFFTITLVSFHVEGDHKKPDWTKYSCWFSDVHAAIIYFYAPVFLLIFSNILMFISTVWKLWKLPQSSATPNIYLKSRRFQCMLYLKLFLIMGICWIFEPVSFVLYDQGRYLWLVTDYINAMQGVIIFLLLVVFRKRVRREFARRGGTCFQKLPREWATMEDEDCEELNEESEEIAQDNLGREDEVVQLNQPL